MNRAEEIFRNFEEQGVVLIDEYIAQQRSEELFLDFKLSSDRGQKMKLSEEDLRNYGEAISGFGNSEGGVIVWGVKCSKAHDGADVPHSKQPIEKPERFKSWLEAETSGRTLPHHPDVRHYVINIGNDCGYVVTLIAKSNYAPHQEIRSCCYFMRSGSSFRKVTHGLLSGMFGRRPQAKIVHEFTVMPAIFDPKARAIVVDFGIMLVNTGMGIGRDVFLNMIIGETISEKAIKVDCPHEKLWISSVEYGACYTVLAPDSLKLPPRARREALRLRVELKPPFTHGLCIQANCGADGSEITHFEIKAKKEDIEKVYAKYFDTLVKGKCSEAERYNFAQNLLGI